MARLKLYSEKNGNVQQQGGLNWGFSAGNVCENDAYVAIPKGFIEKNPDFFPTKSSRIDVEWDDGTHMVCSVEGTQDVQGKKYPKQLTSADDKSVFGEYIRKRMGVSSGEKVTMDDLNKYGRKDIEITKQGDNKYKIDFGVK